MQDPKTYTDVTQHRPSRRSQSREHRRSRSASKKARRRMYYFVAGGSVALALILSLLLPSIQIGSGDDSVNSSSASTPRIYPDTPPDVGTPVQKQAALHIDQGELHIPYNTTPPTSGPHYRMPAAWGIYEQRQEDEIIVHNLEHGGIAINYNIGAPNIVRAITEFVQGQPDYPACIIMQPYPDLPKLSISLTAWGWIQEIDVSDFSNADLDAMQRFIDSHKNRGPEDLGIDCGGNQRME